MGSTPASDVPAHRPTATRWALTGAIVFLVAYLPVNFAGVLSDPACLGPTHATRPFSGHNSPAP
jgi:hypothetical protein